MVKILRRNKVDNFLPKGLGYFDTPDDLDEEVRFLLRHGVCQTCGGSLNAQTEFNVKCNQIDSYTTESGFLGKKRKFRASYYTFGTSRAPGISTSLMDNLGMSDAIMLKTDFWKKCRLCSKCPPKKGNCLYDFMTYDSYVNYDGHFYHPTNIIRSMLKGDEKGFLDHWNRISGRFSGSLGAGLRYKLWAALNYGIGIDCIDSENHSRLMLMLEDVFPQKYDINSVPNLLLPENQRNFQRAVSDIFSGIYGTRPQNVSVSTYLRPTVRITYSNFSIELRLGDRDFHTNVDFNGNTVTVHPRQYNSIDAPNRQKVDFLDSYKPPYSFNVVGGSPQAIAQKLSFLFHEATRRPKHTESYGHWSGLPELYHKLR